ncbi:SH2 domain containing 3Cb [Denticeps clupeoides]|uniref:SH2 domain-containing protein n=1 Tax=Denticeps clupeoides TaxID=299321 RepID=A0AAY4AG79_9TELE|nr:SH2 domain-containing protein 3C-like [Denticeps clupeoides]XP_028832001.1 SH2 domain-containing protein 3C-like [Denticeps clupeoides]XP_028832011.1 SH2 domain-containing protein 3C-like [Denticeps clupeoides]
MEVRGACDLAFCAPSFKDSMENRGEYVKFSKEKFHHEVPLEEELKKDVEEELKLNSNSMLSHGWYHGRIPWEVAETLLKNDGDFLIRDSFSSLGDYVLTLRWKQKPLHFLITRIATNPRDRSAHVQYVLEGEAFDSVPALIRFYVGNQEPLTQQSGAHVYSPVNRTLPLRYLETMFAGTNGNASPVTSPSHHRGVFTPRQSISSTSGLIEDVSQHRGTVRSFAITLEQIEEFCSPFGPIGEALAINLTSHHKGPSGNRRYVVVPSSPVLGGSGQIQLRSSPSNTSLNSGLITGTLSPSDPPSCHELKDDNSYSELPPDPNTTSHAQSHVENLQKAKTDSQDAENHGDFVKPTVDGISAFSPCRYCSLLLPKDNKPLEPKALKKLKDILTQIDTEVLAKYITKVDCMVACIVDVDAEAQKKMGVSSGMELLTLPHGHQFRLDLQERYHTMSFMLAVLLLGCTGTVEERASLLDKLIRLASELKSSLVNLFGFAAVMRALELPQISRLEQTWTALRQHHTETAILYEKILKSYLRDLNEAKESCVPQGASFPYVLPLLSLLEKSKAAGEASESWEGADMGVDIVLGHLVSARNIARNGETYHANTERKLKGFWEQNNILEVFLTEFQIRLLWGSRASEGSSVERHEKFDKVLTALSNLLEPPHQVY